MLSQTTTVQWRNAERGRATGSSSVSQWVWLTRQSLATPRQGAGVCLISDPVESRGLSCADLGDVSFGSKMRARRRCGKQWEAAKPEDRRARKGRRGLGRPRASHAGSLRPLSRCWLSLWDGKSLEDSEQRSDKIWIIGEINVSASSLSKSSWEMMGKI